jgi:hypothetical protein
MISNSLNRASNKRFSHHITKVESMGGLTRNDKIGVGAGVHMAVVTSTTQVWCTHATTKSLSALARRSIS